MRRVLVVNSGSSSLKYRLIDGDTSSALVDGQIDRIGQDSSTLTFAPADGDAHETTRSVPDASAAVEAMLDAFREHGPDLSAERPVAIGHRVVHGGSRFTEPTLVDDDVERGIEELAPLAPLHNPANLAGIRAAARAFPGVPQVAVFDTAFHATIPPAAHTYAIDADVAREHAVRRYGFHGTSHEYVSRAAAEHLGRPVEELRMIVAHLGNGASVCAVSGGRSVDTSMGMTPLEGLVMGTRSGDLDPAVLLHLERTAGFDADALDDLLNKRSGLKGLSGSSDLRDVTEAAGRGDESARLALDVYLHRLRSYLGAYVAVLGGLDALVFTAGVGENSAVVRQGAVDGLGHLGLAVDATRNGARSHDARRISPDDASVPVLVVPTDEELQIARHALAVVG